MTVNRFTQKVGPLPAWAWGAIIGVILIGGVWLNARRNAGTPTTSTTTPATAPVNGLDAFSQSYAAAGGGNGSSAPASDTGATTTTNATWVAQGTKVLTDQGVAPTDAADVLAAYINAGSLTAEQRSLVNAVIARLGLPPEGTAGPTVTPTVPTAADPGDDFYTSIPKQIAALYRQFLGREASQSEIVTWERATGDDYNQIYAGIAGSQEAKNVQSSAAIVSYYQTYLGRTPAQSEVAFWQNIWNTQGQGAVQSGIANSQEAKNKR